MMLFFKHFLTLTLIEVTKANFIAFSGNNCDGVGGSIVEFTGCINLQNRHSFKFVDSLPYSSTDISLWCNGNENRLIKNPTLNQCYNIGIIGETYNNCHIVSDNFPINSCTDINDKNHVKLISEDNDSNKVMVIPVDDIDSEPVYVFDNYQYSYNETIERLEEAHALKFYNKPFNESFLDNEGNSFLKYLLNQLIDLATI